MSVVLAAEARDRLILVADKFRIEKSPFGSLATIALPVFTLVAVVAELLTLPAVAMVASFVSTIPALALMSALTMAPSTIFALVIELSATEVA